MSNKVRDNWWREFFESSDSLELSLFPDERETEREVRGLQRLLGLSHNDRIVDICCGYGRHVARLVKQGYQVVGLDLSAMMVEGARSMLGKVNPSASLIRADAARLPFADESFDVVLNLFNSFGYFRDEGQNRRVLRETARVLKPGGQFLLDTRNREFQIIYAPYCQRTVCEGRELVLRCSYDRESKRMNSLWSLQDDPEAVVHEASIRLYGLDELRQLMEGAGFEELGVYGTYQGDAFEGHHRQLLYVGQRMG